MFEPTVPDPTRIAALHTARQAELAKQYGPSPQIREKLTLALARLGGLLIALGEKLQTYAPPPVANHSAT